ncbi:aldose 1-epimerase [Cupriavidus sp. SZY C1]|uniref:aldose 1-epimerase n=1 Tax=Cupriavidus sp. SZY C1 TaxID=3055037 RepID=UPI0028B2FE58|nr:aldose 1-epimerase [Cupriavidus sp. SZY C1]MDT6960986.1 aldose 1-epimerase [Cupriavidus sp. SZY C1]
MLWLPHGPTHTLTATPHTLTIAPSLGGRMATLRTARADGTVIDWLAPLDATQGFDAHQWPKAGSYPLLPFSNRIREGRFRWQGRDIVVPAHPGQAHAMHGLGHARPWTVAEAGADQLVMTLAHAGCDGGWPWALTAWQTLRLSATGLDAELAIRNDGDSDMPVGGGFHPFLARVPGLRVQFDAAYVWPADAGGVATGRTAVADGERFLRERDLPEGDFSRYYGGWKRTATVKRPDGATLTIRAGEGLDHLVLHAPGGCAFFCLEPVSHVADAVNLAARGWEGTGLRTLAPGDTARWRMQWLLAA